VQVLKLRYADPKDLADGSSRCATAEDAAAPRSKTPPPLERVAAGSRSTRGRRADALARAPGPPESLSAVLDVVSDLDRLPPSVRVEVTVALVDLDERIDLGADYFIPR
jgi:type II secretory pathway component GspD/PulD (secretin)